VVTRWRPRLISLPAPLALPPVLLALPPVLLAVPLGLQVLLAQPVPLAPVPESPTA
jgi:hypothetical protein